MTIIMIIVNNDVIIMLIMIMLMLTKITIMRKVVRMVVLQVQVSKVRNFSTFQKTSNQVGKT